MISLCPIIVEIIAISPIPRIWPVVRPMSNPPVNASDSRMTTSVTNQDKDIASLPTRANRSFRSFAPLPMC